MQLQNKTALVTSGAGQVGRAIVRLFAAEGARVISLDGDEASNQSLAQSIQAQGGSCIPVTGDVCSSADVKHAFEVAGAVDILVNSSAYWQGDGLLLEVSEETWDKVLAVSLNSVYLCCREALETMTRRRSGAIVNITSANALVGIHQAAYTAAAGSVVSFTRILSAQYASYGVRINTICSGIPLPHDAFSPGIPNTARPAMLGRPDDIASAALFIASDQAPFMSGSCFTVDGGLTAIRALAQAE